MIHVCFGLHDKTGHYSKFTGTTMLSIFANTSSEVTVHILHDDTLTNDNREKLSYIAGRYNQTVKFHNVEQLYAEKIEEYLNLIPSIKTSTFSVGAMYRMLIIALFPADIEKIIYLDSDLIINLDIKKLWQIELDDKPLAVVTEISNGVKSQVNLPLCRAGHVKHEDYFNSGVLLMNLKFLRENEETLQRGIKFISDNPEFADNFDQEILNYSFSTQTIKLPNEFNYFVRNARFRSEKKIERKIYHYLSSPFGFGLKLDMSDPFNRLWMDYFLRTPFLDTDAMGRLYDGIQKLQASLKFETQQLSAMLSGKTRAFFIAPHDVESVKKIFQVRDDEEIILIENKESIKNLIDAMKAANGQKVFFIMLKKFSSDALTKEGFVRNKDFVDGMKFLSSMQGMPLNSYNLIKAM